MSVNNGLLGAAGGILGGLGSQKALLYSIYSQACISAVEREFQDGISLYCPGGFNDFSLITIISVCIGLAIFAFFWKDILQEIWNRVYSSD